MTVDARVGVVHVNGSARSADHRGPTHAAGTAAVVEAYEALANHYDAFTGDHRYDEWMSTLEGIARRHGLTGNRVLDVACGTGKSFLPLHERGYRITACDLCSAMVAIARAKLRDAGGDDSAVFVADMRSLAAIGAFDLVTCIDDAVNYLLVFDDLVDLFRSVARNLARDGVFVFDVNTLHTFTSEFERTYSVERAGRRFRWSGRRLGLARRHGVYRAVIEVDDGEGGGQTSTHMQRHHTCDDLVAALQDAGLELCARYGQFPDGTVEPAANEHCHTKAVHVARHVGGRR